MSSFWKSLLLLVPLIYLLLARLDQYIKDVNHALLQALPFGRMYLHAQRAENAYMSTANAKKKPTNPIPVEDQHPVILVHGFLGSMIEGDLDRTAEQVPSWWCERHVKNKLLTALFAPPENPTWWEKLEMIKQIMPGMWECWFDELSLHWQVKEVEEDSHKVKKQVLPHDVGIYSKVVGYDQMECLNSDDEWPIVKEGGLHPWSAGFIGELEFGLGYKNSTINNVFYDWRADPDQWARGEFWQAKQRIECTVAALQKPAVLVSVSQGGYFLSRFFAWLEMRDEDGYGPTPFSSVEEARAWKQEHIATWVSFAGVMGGAGEMLTESMYPDTRDTYNITENLPWIPLTAIRDLVASWSGGQAMMPFYPPNATVYVGPDGKNYSGINLSEAFEAANRTETALLAKKQQKWAAQNIPPPNVPVHCVYGVGFDTVVGVKHANGWDAPHTDLIFADGDSVVGAEALGYCKYWGDDVTVQAWEGYNHMECFNERSVKYFAEVVRNVTEKYSGRRYSSYVSLQNVHAASGGRIIDRAEPEVRIENVVFYN